MPCASKIGLGERERGNAEDGALDRARNRTRIDHVLAGIAATIDAGEHQIGRAILEDVARAHDDAVGGRALDREMTLAHLAQPQGIIERERMRHARLVVFGRYHPYVV